MVRANINELRSSSVQITRIRTLDAGAMLQRYVFRGRRASEQPSQQSHVPRHPRRMSMITQPSTSNSDNMIVDVSAGSSGINDERPSKDRSSGVFGGVAPSHEQQNDTQQDNDEQIIDVPAGASEANDGPSINRSCGVIPDDPPPEQHQDEPANADVEMADESAGTNDTNVGPSNNRSHNVIADEQGSNYTEPADANDETVDSSGGTIDGIGGNDSATAQTAFPGHGPKTGRKSYFSQQQMDRYVQNLQPDGKI